MGKQQDPLNFFMAQWELNWFKWRMSLWVSIGYVLSSGGMFPGRWNRQKKLLKKAHILF